MKICVQGLWHLGSVTAACLASLGHNVVGLDDDTSIVRNLAQGKAPLFEPGLDDLIQANIANGKLEFSSLPAQALEQADVLWVAFDTPVDDDDQADVDFVQRHVQMALPFLPYQCVVLVSSQTPVGFIQKLEDFVRQNLPENDLTFACLPENLRLGKALDVFLNPDRLIVGVRNDDTKKILERLLYTITDKVEWMSVESAEMTKHAINAFLAISVTFANEIAAICELVGADAKEVERGLKTESRIGPKAYLSPGGPFAGGTLARDIAFLDIKSKSYNLITPLLSAVRNSNDQHKNWSRRILQKHFGTLKGVSVAIWGLTYKPDTDTLRRSLSVELCEWLLLQGALVRVYDPAVKQLPKHWTGKVICCSAAMDAVIDAEALVVGTDWPEFKESATALSGKVNHTLLVVDANRHLQSNFPKNEFIYMAVGTPSKIGDKA